MGGHLLPKLGRNLLARNLSSGWRRIEEDFVIVPPPHTAWWLPSARVWCSHLPDVRRAVRHRGDGWLRTWCNHDAPAPLELLDAEGEEVWFVDFFLAHVRIGAHYTQFRVQRYEKSFDYVQKTLLLTLKLTKSGNGGRFEWHKGVVILSIVIIVINVSGSEIWAK